MKVADLFCGCGGLSLGAQKAGMDIVVAYDFWEPALQVYNNNFTHRAEKVDISDVVKVTSSIQKLSCDGIIGGPPCQDFSSAGHRTEGERANLTKAFSLIIANLKTKFFIMENVSRTMKSKTFSEAREIFKSSGYGLTEVVLDASRCGVPQSRKRFFCIGILGEEDRVLEEIINSRLSEKKMTLRDYFGDSLGVEHYYRHPRNYNRRAIYSIDEPSATIRGVNRPVPMGYTGHPNDSSELSDKIRELTTKERSMIQTFPENFIWCGSKTNVEQMIGNAVPVNLAAFISKCVHDYLVNKKIVKAA
ncbi:DNA cytosine methyltransferase [Citrobacter portucalensis]|uniref:DNA cytosine methyltransferase n=1 Tax=Citrobacter portucalensis TaxID=1639133 RepID=UPI0021630618|nr:DNA cytosine methyltransferase [Citrobacter portucalensis]MCS0536405.1 DNA cytosine methyltransferase [Citrobacter portucalensis]MCX9006750.1 DNA cytosine methyltransferase [Citrobacter portucalensis]